MIHASAHAKAVSPPGARRRACFGRAPRWAHSTVVGDRGAFTRVRSSGRIVNSFRALAASGARGTRALSARARCYTGAAEPTSREGSRLRRERSSTLTTARPGNRLRFLQQFLRSPRELGSILPSSRFLARALVDEIDFASARRVVELGPGTGVFTREVLRRLPGDGALLALETNTEFVALLRRELPDPRLTVAHVSAERIHDEVRERGWGQTEVVISGIPYTLLPRKTTAHIVRASWQALAPGGLLVGYQYSPYLRPFLRAAFGNCRMKVVLLNVPPAVVFISRKSPA